MADWHVGRRAKGGKHNISAKPNGSIVINLSLSAGLHLAARPDESCR